MSVPPPPSRTHISIGRALVLFVVYVFVFCVGGGIGAGIPAMLFQLVADIDATRPDYFNLYALMFGVTGYIAYQLARRVAEG